MEKGERLDSWKAIADYLGQDVRTCFNWAKRLGLPVHKLDPESKQSRVYAFKADLDDWLKRKPFIHAVSVPSIAKRLISIETNRRIGNNRK